MKPADARVVLTGACGGLGRAFARELVGAGAAVMLVGRSPARLADQARQLVSRSAAADRQVRWHMADLDKRSDAERLRDAAIEWRANVLVLGTGVPSFGRFDALDPGAIGHVLRTNLLAPILLTQLLLPHLRVQQRAQVICIGSALGRLGLPGFSVYSASKFGLRGFAESLRRELAGSTVRVQYLGPRSTRTPFNDAAVERYNAATKTAMDEPERVAAMLLALLADERAERFIGFPERVVVRLNGLVPAWLDGAFAKHRRSLADEGGTTAARDLAGTRAPTPSSTPLPRHTP